MKAIYLALFAILPFFALAAPAAKAAHDHPSVHGMLVVGTERVYLSHLPMFHAPHAYQMIAEATLPPAVKAVYLTDRAAHPEQKIYTLVPEPFVLSEMASQPRPFKADLYRGHFERGGTPIAQKIVISLSAITYFQKFHPKAKHPTQLQYLAFGQPGGEQFLAHLITAAPDFDHVLATSGLTGSLPRTVEFAESPAKTPLQESANRQEIYLETGDLAD